MTSIIDRRIERVPIQIKMADRKDFRAIAGFARLMLKKMIAATQTPHRAESQRWLKLAAIAPRLGQIASLENIEGEWAVGNRFMIATQKGKIVGLNQFIRSQWNELHSVITCVSPDYGGRGLGPRLHRYTWARGIRIGMEGVHSLLATQESKKMYERMREARKGKENRGAHIRIHGTFLGEADADAHVTFRPRSSTRRRGKPH
jgi:hypothetical protein